ncbi:hypothetical protein FGIG_04133 [Fasciola gigantica]|uniref:Uncharacterized protein n=1 Tax=Fasciola gigantica TaxID=46835 RepID=A0A504Z298_FASGI|nr:hypothetical protein FGIG_04133 [Fasciola gigantica]
MFWKSGEAVTEAGFDRPTIPSVGGSGIHHPKIASIFDDCFPPRYEPRLGTSLIELCLPLACDCSKYVFDKILRCLSLTSVNSSGPECLLIDCCGQFSVLKFAQFLKTEVCSSSSREGMTTSASFLEEVLSKLHIIRVFTNRELTMALYASRDVLRRNSVSSIFIYSVASLSDLQRHCCDCWKAVGLEQTLWMGMLSRLVFDFNLLCVCIRHGTSFSSNKLQSRDTDENEHLTSPQKTPPEIHRFMDSMSFGWTNGISHRIEIFSCSLNFISYFKQGGQFKVLLDKRNKAEV